MRFFHITRADLSAANDLLRDACAARAIDYVEVLPAFFDYESSPRPGCGDLLFRGAVDPVAWRLEQALAHPGVAGFAADPLVACTNPLEAFARNGLPTPRTVYSADVGRAQLDRHVDYLGGFPVVLKTPGGVVRVDSRESLYSVMDYMGGAPLLMAFVDHAAAWRLLVVGDGIADAEVRYPSEADFRAGAAPAGAPAPVDPPEQALRLALQAARVLGLEFGQADILLARSGQPVLIGFESPCDFAARQHEGGTDIAGRMVDHLAAKARAMPAVVDL